MQKTEITIDAEGKKLGRLASEVASALRGKTSAHFLPYVKILPKITVKNVDAINFSEKKLKEKTLLRYSGYPGGLKKQSAWSVAAKDKRNVLKHAVSGMLPKNKLRKIMLKKLIQKDGEDW